MKRFTLLVAAVAALFATSCVKEQLSDVQVNGADAIVSFSVAAPELGSRAIGDGLKATHLVYAVYDKDWNYLTEGTATFNNLVANVSLRLVNNKEYNFAFWASVEGNAYYTFDTATATVEVNYSGAANDENRDAFWGHKTGLVVNGTMNESVQLYRPFAQVNWGTNDVLAAKTGGFDITTTGTAVYEAEAYTTLSLKDGSVGGLQNVTFTAADLVSNTTGEALVTASLGSYTWLAMNYLLWSADQGTLTVNKLTVTDNVGQQVVVSYPNANVQRNYRTNLVGSLLTDQVNIVVEIVPVFDGETDILVATAGSWTEFTEALANSDYITLTDDITYNGNYTLTKDITIDLNGKSLEISNPSLALNISSDATIVNGTIEGKVYARSGSDITFEGVTFGGSVNGGGSTEGAVQIQGGCNVYMKDCTFDATNSNTTKSRPLSIQATSSGTYVFENCSFKSNLNQNQVYVNSLSGTAKLSFINCNFNNKTPNIMFAASYPFTGLTMTGTTKLSSVTLEINRAKDAVTDADLAYLREMIANNSFSSFRLFYAGGASEYIR